MLRGKLASHEVNGHDVPMRYLVPAALALTLAACASAPTPAPAPVIAAPVQRPAATSALVGLTASELITRFGQPSFQVREGVGIKLQWSANGCVLDTYLYPPASGRGSETRDAYRHPAAIGRRTIDQPDCVGLLLR